MRYWSLSFLVLIGFNLLIWHQIVFAGDADLELYFLKVGQGDSEFVELPGGVQILIDGGPDKSVLFELAKVMPSGDRYIDLVIMTHPQLDHFAGLEDVVQRYKIGAFVTSGKEGESESWKSFEELLIDKNIPIVLASAGDRISYKNSLITVLAPNGELMQSKELNDTSLVLKLESEGTKSFFTGDAGFPTENYLLSNLSSSDDDRLDVDVLKVAHHGSKYSTGSSFLNATTPFISIVEVGKNNYGHPVEGTLNRLKTVGSVVYRTDLNGTIHLIAKDGKIAVYPEIPE